MGKVTRLLILGLVLTVGAGVSVQAGHVLKDFWLLDDYLKINPNQQEISNNFSQTIQAAGQKGTTKQKRPVKIVMVYPGLQASDYWRRSVSSFKARMDELGLNFVLEDHFTKPGTDIRLQSQLISQVRTDKPDYLVFTLDAFRHRSMIERIMARGATKVILQNITTPIRAFGQQQPFLYVGFDHGVGAKMLADKYKAVKPEGGRYAIFYGPRGYVSQMRGGVFQREMSTHPNTELVASYYVNFDRKKSYQAALELLAEDADLDFIYACSTDIALGIIDALKETGKLGTVMVNGWGGGSAELDAIKAGELNFTVMRMNDDNGIAMAEAIRLDLVGEIHSVPQVYSGEFKLVSQGISPQDLTALENYAFRYSK